MRLRAGAGRRHVRAGDRATNWFTAAATFLESDGAAALPANAAAAAISIDAALRRIRSRLLDGRADASPPPAAPAPATVDRQRHAAAAGSAWAIGLRRSAAARPTHRPRVLVNIVLIDDMTLPVNLSGFGAYSGRVELTVRAARRAGKIIGSQ